MTSHLRLLLFTFFISSYSCISQENNVLLIIADDLGVDALNGYMPEAMVKANTPTLDSLRNSGLTFTKAWTNPICSPTRSAIISGKYGFRTEVLNAEIYSTVDQSELTLHKHLGNLSDGAINNCIIGKWHLGGSPQADSDYPEIMGVSHHSGIMIGGVPNYSDWTYTENGVSSNSTEYVTTKLTDEAINWINTQEGPWLCWLAYNAPHTPFHLPPAELHSNEDLVDDPVEIENNPLSYFMTMIESLDTEIARLIAEIPEEELDNTTIIFIGDNGTTGQAIQAPYTSNRSKGSLFQGGVHVPLIISGNQTSRINEIDSSLIVSTDLFCTITELMGFQLNQFEDSYSFLDLLSQEGTGQRECSFTDIYNTEKGYGWAARDERYKYSIWDSVPERFYDLWLDPFEQTSLLNGMGNLNPEEQDAFDKLSNMRGTLSISESIVNSFELFPNPLETSFNIKTRHPIEQVQIFDSSGRLMESINGAVNIDISSYKSGIYLVRIGNTTKRIIKL